MADEPQNLRCRRCGYPLAAQAPTMGLCPRCLLARVLDIRQNVQNQLDRIRPWPDPPSPESLTAALPQLEVLELLAWGGMGLVYRARQRSLDREVALKILPIAQQQNPDAQARFLAEARILAGLNHPNIVMAIEAGQTAEWLYLVMELVHGPSLRDVLKRQGTLQPRHALTIAAQVAGALACAHARQIIHRDVKPENILLDPGAGSAGGAGAADTDLDAFFAGAGRARLADFGIAKPMEASDRDITLTAPHQYVGTADYLAPECRQAGHGPSLASDVYALGIVLYEMLTGRVPAGHFPPPSHAAGVPRWVDAIVLRCLASEAADRYADAGLLQRDLDRALRPRRGMGMVRIWVGAIVLAGLVIAAVFLPNRQPKPSPEPDQATPPAVRPMPATQPDVELPASQPSVFVLMPGDAVKIKWGSQWYHGTVVQREGRRVLVHYDGWNSSFDEWVGPDRLSW